MVAGNGVPIRLVQEDGNLINLTATRLTMSVERRVGSHPMKFMGSGRWSLDLNQNTAVILIDGVFVDDQAGETIGSNHEAHIDFAGNEFATVANLTNFTNGSSAKTASSAEIGKNSRFILNRADGTLDDIFISKMAGTGATDAAVYRAAGGSINRAHVEIAIDAEASEIATAVAAYINAELGSHYTASTINTIANGATATGAVLKIVHDASATSSAPLHTPSIGPNVRGQSQFNNPILYTFSGGKSSKIKSAGDKVQDLYGLLNNSKRNSHVRQVIKNATMGLAAGALVVGTGGGAAIAAGGSAAGMGAAAGGAGALGGTVGGLTGLIGVPKEDYIVGIQIPYNSKVNVTGSSEYEGRYFFMPTGGKTSGMFGQIPPEDKGSENAPDLNTTFDSTSQFTGMSGTVSKLDVNYDAGESVYAFTMQFLPIDWMI